MRSVIVIINKRIYDDDDDDDDVCGATSHWCSPEGETVIK